MYKCDEADEIFGQREKARVLPIFHGFTGCGIVSFFSGGGKRSSMETWIAYKDFTNSYKTRMNRK